MRKTTLVVATLLSTSLAAQEFATNFKSTEVSPGIFMIEGADGFAGGNMGLLVGNDYVAMIDDGLEPTAPALLDFVSDTAGRPIDFLVNTHVHGDHAGGNAHFADNDTVIFAHENIRKRLQADPSPAGGIGGLPVITFSKGVNFHLTGIEAYVHHVSRAHTDGDSIIVFPEANVIHTGDVWFHKLFPFIDLDNGGSLDGFIAAQRRVIELADRETKIIPGHGTLASETDLEADLAMLIDSRARVLALVEDGKSEEEIVEANPLADYHDTYNWGFITTERMTRTLYRALSGN